MEDTTGNTGPQAHAASAERRGDAAGASTPGDAAAPAERSDATAQGGGDATANSGRDAAASSDAIPPAGDDAGPIPEADAAPRGDDAGESAGERGKVEPSEEDIADLWETGDPGPKTRPLRRRSAEALVLAGFEPKVAGILAGYDDRFRTMESTIGGISHRLQTLSDAMGVQSKRIENAMATEQDSIRTFIKTTLSSTNSRLLVDFKNEIVGEMPVLTDRFVEILAKRDIERDAAAAESNARLQKDIEETYKATQYNNSSIGALSRDLEIRTNAIGKSIRDSTKEVEDRENAILAMVGELQDNMGKFESNLSKFLQAEVRDIKPRLDRHIDETTGMMKVLTDQVTGEIVVQAADLRDSQRRLGDEMANTVQEQLKNELNMFFESLTDEGQRAKSARPDGTGNGPDKRASGDAARADGYRPNEGRQEELTDMWATGAMPQESSAAPMAEGAMEGAALHVQRPARTTDRDPPPHMTGIVPPTSVRTVAVIAPAHTAQPVRAAPMESSAVAGQPAQAQVAIPQGYQLVPLQAPAQRQTQERIKFKDAKHFSGADNEDVDLWIREVTNELRFGGRTDQEIVDGLPLLLEGEAKRWLNRLSLAQRTAIVGWEAPGGWQDVLRTNFRAANYETKARQQLSQLRWEEGQSFTEYFEKRSELQVICCAGYSEAALIEDMLSGMSATDQAEARKEVRDGRTLLQWKRAVMESEAAMRARHDMVKQIREMSKQLSQMNKATTQRRTTLWTQRPGQRRAQDGAQQDQQGGGQQNRSSLPATRSSGEKPTSNRQPFGRTQRPHESPQETQGPSQRTARTQVAEVEDPNGEEDDFEDDPTNEGYDPEAEADFVECLVARSQPGPIEGQRRSPRFKRDSTDVQARELEVDARGSQVSAEPPAQDHAEAGSSRTKTNAPAVQDDSGQSTAAQIEQNMSYENKSPAYISAKFAEDETGSVFKICADTGSSITLVDRGVARKFFSLCPARPERLINVKGVGGQTSIAQSLALHIIFTDTSGQAVKVPARFFINPVDDDRVILGNDFMEAFGANIDIARQVMTLTSNVGIQRRIVLSTRKDRVPLLRTTEAFVLKPYHRAMINVRLSSKMQSETFLIDPLPIQNGTVAVSVRRGIARANKATHMVEVYNLDPWPYRFESGEVVARAEMLLEGDSGGGACNMATASEADERRDRRRFKEALRDLDINPSLSHEQKQRLEDVLMEHRHAFAYGDRPLGLTNLGKVRIDTGDASPVSSPPFRVSPEGRKFIEQEIARLLASDVIEEADSPWAANVVLIKQKQKIRFCVDYRKVNAVTRTDQYPLPRIDDYLNQFQGKRYFSTFDANSSFNQVEIEECDREKTAFRTHVGLFQYKRMPFGLKNGPSIFQRCMDKALGPTKWQFAVVYIDDIVVYSADFDTHLQHVSAILSRIIPTGFTLSLAKSHICYQEIHALGHRVSTLGIGMKGENVKAILNYPRPKNTKQIQVFLGMAGYYRRFIKNFASIARPLTKLLAKDQEFVWSSECDEAFHTLRKKLAEEPILAHPDYSKDFTVHTDASTLGLGAVLAQKDDEGRERIVCAISRALEERERRLSATELECLALVWAMRQFRPYVDGVGAIKIITDHAALQWIYDYKGTNRKLQRWSLELQPWRDRATIIHRPGRVHSNVDALSRSQSTTEETPAVADVLTVSALQPNGAVLSKIRQGYLTDQFFAAILEQLQSCARRGTKPTGTLATFELQDGIVFRRTSDNAGLAMCIPRHESLRSDILHDFHDAEMSGHMGWEKTFAGLARLYYWPKLRRDVKTYVGSCDKCQKNKHSTRPPAGLLQPLQVVTERWHTVTMDFAGPFVKSPAGNDSVLIAVDKCTKRVHFAATKQSANAKATAQVFIANVVRLHGLPRILLSDRDKKFTSQFWTEMMSKLGVKTAFSTANHPQTDGQSEAAVKVLKTILRQYINYKQDNWEEILPLAEIAYNSSVNASTGHTPFELDTGYSPRMPHDVMNSTDRSDVREVDELLRTIKEKTEEAAHSLREAQQRQAQYHDAGRQQHEFRVDDLVLLSTKHITPPWAKKQKVKKLRPLWIGPYRVTDVVNINSYGLELPADMRIHSTINVEYLKPYVTSPDEWASRTQYGLPIQEEQGIEFFAPEAILDREERGATGRAWYLVKWKGRPMEEASWRPGTELLAAVPRMVKEFDEHRA